MTQTSYDDDGYMIIPGVIPQPIPLTVRSCNGQTLECTNRDYWIDAWRVVDARPGTMWPVGGPKGRHEKDY